MRNDTRSDSDTKHVLPPLHFRKINKFNALRKRIREIVILEERPFSFLDLKSFEVDGMRYELKHGTIRNYLSKLAKSGEIGFAFYSGVAFYTLPSTRFTKQVTGNHVEGPLSLIHQLPIKNTPIYKWLRNRRFDKQALHDIRLTFEAMGIWTIFNNRYSNLADNYNNNDIRFPTLTFFKYLDIGITVHHSDTVSISIGCSYRPIALDIPDILQLIEALVRTEVHLTNTINESIVHDSSASRVSVPRFTTWIVKMWHFGIDTLDEYDKKEFHVTFNEGISDLFRIYSKRMNDKRVIVRAERQEYPNQDLMIALVKKLYPNGYLSE
jgi:hypothetical protein